MVTFNDLMNGQNNFASSVDIVTATAGIRAYLNTCYMLCVEKTRGDLFWQLIAIDEWLLFEYQ